MVQNCSIHFSKFDMQFDEVENLKVKFDLTWQIRYQNWVFFLPKFYVLEKSLDSKIYVV